MGPKAKSSAKRLNQVCRTKCYELTLWVYNFMPFVAICLSKQPPFHRNTQKSLPRSQGFGAGVTVPSFSSFPLSLILSFHPLCLHPPQTWSLAMDKSSTALQHRFKGHNITIIKEFALGSKMCSLAKFISIQENDVSDQRGGRREKEEENSGGQ